MEAKKRNEVMWHELERIRKASPSGLLMPGDVVTHAVSEESPLHKCFTWDDSEAAHKCRMMEARQLIRTVSIEYAEGWDQTRRVPAYVSLMGDRSEDGGYRPTEQVITSDDLRAQLMRTAKSELASWANRHKLLTDLVESVSAVAGIEPPKSRKKAIAK